MADKPPKITAADVRAALLLRYPAQSHALLFEVAPRTGGGTRYADAVAVGLWASHGHKIEGFEIKVARADWLAEMKQPEKSEPVLRHCHHWWLACPKGVAQVDELPPNWGLIELQAGGQLRVRVQAPKLEPAPVTLGFFASLVRRGVEADNAVVERVLATERAKLRTQIRAELERARADQLSYKHQQALDAVARLEALQARTGIDFASYQYGDDWFAAVDLLCTLGADFGRDSLRAVRDGLRQTAERIDRSGLLLEAADAD